MTQIKLGLIDSTHSQFTSHLRHERQKMPTIGNLKLEPRFAQAASYCDLMWLEIGLADEP